MESGILTLTTRPTATSGSVGERMRKTKGKDEVDHNAKNEDGGVIDFSAVPTSWMINSNLRDGKKMKKQRKGVRFSFLFFSLSNPTQLLTHTLLVLVTRTVVYLNIDGAFNGDFSAVPKPITK